MSVAHPYSRTPQSSASPILMERVIHEFEFDGDIRQALSKAGATSELLADLVVVVPGNILESYRFAFAGSDISARLGWDICGQSFGNVLQFSEALRSCLAEFERSIEIGEKIISRHRYDFSAKWVIEYSRVIYPVIAKDARVCAIGHYVFHDHNLEGRYF